LRSGEGDERCATPSAIGSGASSHGAGRERPVSAPLVPRRDEVRPVFASVPTGEEAGARATRSAMVPR
jgi:hypothetical protein